MSLEVVFLQKSLTLGYIKVRNKINPGGFNYTSHFPTAVFNPDYILGLSWLVFLEKFNSLSVHNIKN